MKRNTLAQKLTLGATCLWLGAGAAATAVQADTLADALVGAYNTSGLLEQNRAVLRAADEDVAQAIASLRPVLSWTSQVTRDFGVSRSNSSGNSAVGSASNTASLGLSAELTLFDYGQNRLAIEATKEAVLGTRQTLVAVEQQILLRAVNAFMEVRRATETVALRQNNLRLITQELRAARDRFEVGEVTRTDVALAEARLAASRSAQTAAQGDLSVAQEEYRAAVGHAPGNLIAPRSVPQLPPSTAAASATAVRTHPEIIAAQYNVSVSELSIRRAEAAMKPTVTLNGSLGATQNYDNKNFSQSGSVSIRTSGPIYQGGRLSSLVRQAMASRDAQRSALLQTRIAVEQNVANSYVGVQVARASRTSSADQVRASQVAYEGVREEATLGARTTLDVLNAEQELLDARANQISSVVDEYIAAYSVLAAMGVLTAQQLGLNVQQYDPASYYNLVKDAPVQSRQGDQLNRVLRAIGRE
ncbi:TolC family outer membrane protein [Puniceibacterium sp. IMCC21224]|uniref:TolC family outer membrane protein n=1 Tax=Puniceibacterium sp. IMCC21224 TaxID=1618204 RepID=UPI00065D8CE3|nr:TolC family outer membrane protein [Puniceibacterium sp. IMCC21224]KMK66114.1 type I secretion outer membrane protein, TolC family [Puniceibacterium sp. IMCC21224]